MANVKKLTASFGVSSRWQEETYLWAKEQCGENESAWLKSVLHHLYLQWKEEQKNANTNR
jgi:hypothetical protein